MHPGIFPVLEFNVAIVSRPGRRDCNCLIPLASGKVHAFAVEVGPLVKGKGLGKVRHVHHRWFALKGKISDSLDVSAILRLLRRRRQNRMSEGQYGDRRFSKGGKGELKRIE